MKKLYFMRHGISAANVEHRFSNDDEPLTEEGKFEVKLAAEAAKAQGITIDLIITSPLPRTQETAKIVAEILGVDDARIEVSNFVREREVGELKGQPQNLFYTPGRVYKDIDYIQGAETIAAMQDRARDALQAIQERFENNILVVSHAAFGRAFMRAVHRVPYTDEYRDTMPHDTPENARLIELI
ncbi:MAG TPA: histidine phosphatase family protein [Candidatus Saccharimonadales bacterium]|nr:histidine phosphatase family protein [Candidatus Saccharimonadales bacterium]